MPGRKFAAGSGYRYGFNGQEKSTELNSDGNLYAAEFWQYDSRIGRRWNIDPVKKHSLSPYMTFGGNPIIMVDPNGNDEYWQIDKKTGTIKMTKSDWVSDNIWIMDKDGQYKKLNEIKIEFTKESRQFDIGVASVLTYYAQTSTSYPGYSSLVGLSSSDNPEQLAHFDPNTKAINVNVVNGYINKDLTNMFNLSSVIVDHERNHESDFANNIRTNVQRHLEIYQKQMDDGNFSLGSTDFQAGQILSGLNYLYTLKEGKLLDKEKLDFYFAKFYKTATTQGWSINATFDNSEEPKVTGFEISNRNDQTHTHYEGQYTPKTEEETP